ncbi:MAG TPA: 50S ribosomal protein L25 [Candidatus Parcubacteria bacterium]|nr:50S ribosomal protein L25 [Candidatus Parcubacteria bacterium]
MISLSVKERKEKGKNAKKTREKGFIPAVLYGPKIKENRLLEVEKKAFQEVYKEAGESSLISLEIEKENKKYPVLIYEVQIQPLSGEIVHIDFYQPSLDEEVETTVPLVFEGLAPAVKELGGTLIKNISEIEVKALPLKLPKEIKVNVETLKTFDDEITIADLKVPEGVKIIKEPGEVVALVVPPEKVEEELEKPVEEEIEEAEKITKGDKEKEKEQGEGEKEEKKES